MKYFSNTSARRNTALMVLLLWLFALASGVANACLLEVRETHAHVAAAASFEMAHALDISPGHAGAIGGHDDISQNFKGPCQKVCDDGSRSFPKLDLTVSPADPGSAMLVAVIWIAATSVASEFRRMDDMQQPVTPGLPIRVRYSRLAL